MYMYNKGKLLLQNHKCYTNVYDCILMISIAIISRFSGKAQIHNQASKDRRCNEIV